MASIKGHRLEHTSLDEGNKSDSAPSQKNVQLDFEGAETLVERRGWLLTLLLQLLSALWLVPIIALLYLNFSEYIIGASAWCPNGHCYLDTFNPVGAVVERNLRRFNKGDHDLLGALQFVAKALEVWFCVIAAAFVYLVTMRIANQREGLPIGYLTRHIEFADLVSLVDPLLWTSSPSPWKGAQNRKEQKLGQRVWALIGLTICLCALCNLMGPATAVLVIPSLQWISTSHIGNRTFSQLNAGQPPTYVNDNWFWWDAAQCNFADFDQQNWSCTQIPFGESLDAWLQSYIASGLALSGSTQQDQLSLQFNYSYESSSTYAPQWQESQFTFWAPSRQIISNLSIDLDMITWISEGYSETQIEEFVKASYDYPDPYDTYVEYNKSLELTVQRNGPIAGGLANMWLTQDDYYGWVVDVDKNRQLRCYSWYDLYWSPIAQGNSQGNYTKCIRTGSGWSNVNKMANFSVEGGWNYTSNSLNPGIDVEIFTSDRAVFFPNGTIPSWLPAACLTDKPVLNRTYCDWDRLFTIDPTSPVANRSQNVNTLEMTLKRNDSSIKLAVDFTALFAFTTYSLNPSPQNNPTGLVQTLDLPSTGTSFAIDPAWILAAWSVDAGGTLLPDRPMTNGLLDVMSILFDNPDQGLSTNSERNGYKLGYVSILPIIQTLSIIDHSTHFTSDTAASQQNAAQPLLQRNAEMYVWAYSMGSRTSWVGVIVAILGAIVVIAQVFLGFLDRRPYRSPTQLVVAALEHAPRGEFEQRREEKVVARTRFHVRDNAILAGKFSFYEPEGNGEFRVDRPG